MYHPGQRCSPPTRNAGTKTEEKSRFMKKSAVVATVLACGAVALLTGCGGASSDDSLASGTTTAAVSPTTSVVGATESPSPSASVPADGTAPADPGSPPPAAEPTPVAPGEPAPNASWDPCSIPEAELTAAGLDTATEEPIADPTYPGKQVWCRWQATDRNYTLTIGAPERTIDELVGSGEAEDVRRTEFYGRPAVQYRSVQDVDGVTCDLATARDFGAIVFHVRNNRPVPNEGDPCSDAGRLIAALVESLP